MASRTPDPRRLLDAHRQAQVTIDLLKAYAAAAYADLPKINRAVGSNEPARPVSLFTSHEALLLNYEQALTRFDEADRKSVVEGTSVSVRLDRGGRRIIKKQQKE